MLHQPACLTASESSGRAPARSLFGLRAPVVAAAVFAALLAAGCATAPGEKSAATGRAAGENLPNDPNALVLGAEVALQRGDYLEATQAYVKAATLSSDEEVAEQAARVGFENEQWSLVQQAADRWLELNPTNEEAHRFAAFAALHLYHIDTAAEHLGALLDSAFINPQAGFLALLPQLGEEGTPPAATAVLQKLLPRYSGLAEAHYALGQASVQSDNFAQALEQARKAHELSPYWGPPGLLLARVQMLTGQTDEALATARQVLERDDRDSYRMEYALLLLQAGKEDEGRRELEALARNEDTAAVVERTLADIEFQIGDRESAAQRFAKLVQSGRFVYESLFYLGVIAESRQQWDEALQLYSRVTNGELAMAAQNRAARIKAQREGITAGLIYLEEFAATRPQHRVAAIIARAGLMASSGDRAGGLALLDQGLAQYPDAVELKFARIFQLEQDDKVDESIAALRRLDAERPEDPSVQNALGYTLVDRTRRHREGFKLIEQAFAQTPDNGAVLDSMGWALHRLGKNEEALKYLEHARERINDPEVELHIGDVLLALDRNEEAREVLTKALERYPGNDELKQRLEKMR